MEGIAQLGSISKSAFLTYTNPLSDLDARLLNAIEFIALNASNEYSYYVEYISWGAFNSSGTGIVFRIKYDTNRFITIYNSNLIDSLSSTRKRYVVNNNDYYCELVIDWSKIAATGDYTNGTAFKIANNYYLLNKINEEITRATTTETTIGGNVDTINSRLGDSDLTLIQSFNRINPNNYLADTYFDANGTFHTLAGRSISDAIYCENRQFIWANGLAVGFWDKNGLFLQYVNSYADNKVIVPTGAYTLRIHGFSNANYFVCFQEQHTYIPYGKTEYDIELDEIRSSIGNGGGGNSNITGYPVTVNGMIISIGAGTINGIESQPVQLTLTAPVTSIKTLTRNITTSYASIIDDYSYICSDCDVLEVRNSSNILLTAGVDYEVSNSPVSLDTWWPYKMIRSLTGQTISGSKIQIRYKYSRIDRIAVNTVNGTVSLVKGYENKNAVVDNPTVELLSDVGTNLVTIYNVFVRWSATQIYDQDILDVRGYNRLGYSIKEYETIDFLRKEKAKEIYPFYGQITYNNLRQLPANSVLTEKRRIVRIGFIGDSRTEGEQIENIHNGIYYGYPYSFARAMNDILQLPTSAYYQSHVNRLRVGRVSIGSPEYLQVLNYGKGGNMIQEFMHSYYGYFDATTTLGDNTISVKSYNGQDNVHDLVFVNVTNPIFNCYELLDSQCPTNLYKNNYSDSDFSLLYDIATRTKAGGGHYELTLHPQSDYGDLSTDTHKRYVYEDMIKVQVAMYQRLIDSLKSQNPNVQIIVLFGMPNQIGISADIPSHFDTNAENDVTMYNLAKSNNCLFFNLSYLFRDCERRLGIYPLLTEYPEGNIHPSPYLHWIIGEVLSEFISKEII
jgi:hypothetical protein